MFDFLQPRVVVGVLIGVETIEQLVKIIRMNQQIAMERTQKAFFQELVQLPNQQVIESQIVIYGYGFIMHTQLRIRDHLKELIHRAVTAREDYERISPLLK